VNVIHNYARLDGETDQELIYRICSEKDKIGTWSDVKNILNRILHKTYGESTYRKSYQSFNKMMEANRNKFVNSNEQLEEINKQIEELKRERIKLQTSNIERNRIDRSVSRQEMYYEYVGNAITSLPLPEFNPFPIENKEGETIEYLVALSDMHYGATFKSENNEYSPDIARDRLVYLTEELVQFTQKNKIGKLNIVCLGDVLQGLIHLTDLKINDSTVVKSCVEICRLIAMMLNTLSAYTQIEYYHVPSANHTQIRALGARANELMDEDLEYLIGNYIKDLCRDNKRINVHLASEGKQYLIIPVNGYDVIAMHGHQIKNIENSIKDISMMRREFTDYLLLGHLHAGKQIVAHEGCCNDSEVLVAGSFVGSDSYSDSLFKGSKASVSIYGFDYVYGHTETYKIILN
jgi:hypothetical protein